MLHRVCIPLALQDIVYVDGWQMDLIWVQLACRHKLLNFSETYLPSFCNIRVEITG